MDGIDAKTMHVICSIVSIYCGVSICTVVSKTLRGIAQCESDSLHCMDDVDSETMHVIYSVVSICTVVSICSVVSKTSRGIGQCESDSLHCMDGVDAGNEVRHL